jgi:hypothetical protein
MNLYNTWLLYNGKITICTVRSQTHNNPEEGRVYKPGGEGWSFNLAVGR